MSKEIDRRSFLAQATAAAVTGPVILSARAVGSGSNKAPSERIGVGIVGCGSMALGHARRLVYNPEVQVVGVCDPNRKKRKQFKDLVNEAYATQTGQTRYRGCVDYNDFQDLLANPDVDAIWVVTPDHWHVIPALTAIRMGKAAYVEKPLTLTIEEGRVLADEVERTGGILQCGSQQRSNQEFARVVELVRNGRIGKLQRVEVGIHPGDRGKGCTEQPVPDWLDYDLWLGQAPWAPYCPERCGGVRSWISIRDYGGGRIASWGSHHLDIVQWALDTDNSGPVKIEGSGTFPESGIVNHAITWDVNIHYASGVTVHLTNTPPPDPYIKFIGAKGTIFITRRETKAEPANLLDSVIGPDEFHARTSDNHYQNFLDCIRSGDEPVAPAEIAHRSATVCHLVNHCLILGRPLHWNPLTERFVNDAEANAVISRKMRAPWHL